MTKNETNSENFRITKQNLTMKTETQDQCPICLRTIQEINEGNSDCYCLQ
jgi:hypothetical protein